MSWHSGAIVPELNRSERLTHYPRFCWVPEFSCVEAVNVVIVFVHFRFSFVQKRESQRASGGSELRQSQQVSGLTGAVGRRQGEWRSLRVATTFWHRKRPPRSFGRLVGSAAGHFRDVYTTVRLTVEERTVAWSIPGGDKWVAALLRFPFFCLVVAFRKPEEFLVREGRTLCLSSRFRTRRTVAWSLAWCADNRA
jgi:hypothetical protein